MTQKAVHLTKIEKPIIFNEVAPTMLTDQTMAERKQKF